MPGGGARRRRGLGPERIARRARGAPAVAASAAEARAEKAEGKARKLTRLVADLRDEVKAKDEAVDQLKRAFDLHVSSASASSGGARKGKRASSSAPDAVSAGAAADIKDEVAQKRDADVGTLRQEFVSYETAIRELEALANMSALVNGTSTASSSLLVGGAAASTALSALEPSIHSGIFSGALGLTTGLVDGLHR